MTDIATIIITVVALNFVNALFGRPIDRLGCNLADKLFPRRRIDWGRCLNMNDEALDSPWFK